MSYIDETYGKQLEEALRGLVSRPALGQPWFGFHASEVPAGVLLFTATTHSRVLYADFWKYIQDKNLVKTEEEWQSIYSEQGWCPFYSDGDGIDTFRMPSAPLYLHGANTLGEAGKYIEAGLPNIEGDTGFYSYKGGNPHGAFSSNVINSAALEDGNVENLGYYDLFLSASSSNSIYGNSDTVTPETSKMLFGVWAISAPQQPIPDATIEGIISELGVASNNALEAKNSLNKAMPVGTVIAFSSNSTPDGFLLCNGAAVSRTTYAKLFETIGTIYGAGDGSTTFNLPDTRGLLIEGQAYSPVGTYFEAGLPQITGGAFGFLGDSVRGENAFRVFGEVDYTVGGGSGVKLRWFDMDFAASRSSGVYGKSGTVQPPSVVMRYYIKY